MYVSASVFSITRAKEVSRAYVNDGLSCWILEMMIARSFRRADDYISCRFSWDVIFSFFRSLSPPQTTIKFRHTLQVLAKVTLHIFIRRNACTLYTTSSYILCASQRCTVSFLSDFPSFFLSNIQSFANKIFKEFKCSRLCDRENGSCFIQHKWQGVWGVCAYILYIYSI